MRDKLKMSKVNECLNKYILEKKIYYSNYDNYSTDVPPNTEGYIWRSNHDERVRESHQMMDGKFVPQGQPPTLDGLTGDAGTLPNCRCWQEKVNI